MFDPCVVVRNLQVKLWPHADAQPDRAFTITLTAADGDATITRSVGTFTIYGN